MDVYDVLTRFPGAKRSGAGWQARCPAHDDRTPSLTINEGDDGRILLCCHVGCSLDAILAALSLSVADLFAERQASPLIVAEYSYLDERGTLLYQVVRFQPKGFRQRRPNGADGWAWSLGDVRRVLYRLPELATSLLVHIVEGEKDADRLRSLGLTATCNPNGAGKWRRDYSAQLVTAGIKRVVVFPDSDAPGRAHADAVARSCHAAGLAVQVVELPDLSDKGDVSDFLDRHSEADLLALVAGTAIYTPVMSASADTPRAATTTRHLRLTPASEIAPRPVQWLWTDRIPLGAITLLGGREGVGKTLCAYTLAADLTCGRLSGVFEGIPKAVLVAATEDSWAHVIVPRLLGAGADLTRVYRVDALQAETETALTLPKDVTEMRRKIAEVGAALLVLDPLLSRLDAALDTHVDAQVRQGLEPLSALADASGLAVVGIIHVNKGTSGDVLTSLMGSRAFAAVARAVLVVMKDPDDERVRLLGQAKSNLGRMDLPTLTFQIVGACVAVTDEGDIWTGQLQWLGESDRSIHDAMEASAVTPYDRTATADAGDWLADYLADQGGTADSNDIKTAGKAAGHSKDSLQRARKRLAIGSTQLGYPRRAFWSLPSPPASVDARPGETAATASTAFTASTDEAVGAVGAVDVVGRTLPVMRPLDDPEEGDPDADRL